MKKLILIIFILTGLTLTAGLFFVFNSEEVLFESKESKTMDLGAVYNKIKWVSSKDQDVWMMNQSHHGVEAEKNKWERIAIVIDKTKTPYQASYYQFEPGSLDWNPDLIKNRKTYRASCFLCHNNGPRAIRPQEQSVSIKDKIIIAAWNLRIKTYGRVVYNPIHDQEDKKAEVVFRHHMKGDNDRLKVKSCMVCHKESGFLSRGLLSRQQRGTIKHLVENNQMPPAGFSLTENDKKELRNFLRGF
jgi:hypothetical protein